MNVGIIGAGNISDTHARAAESIANTTVVAVCGDNRDKAESLARRHRATSYDALDPFLRHRAMDAVFIGSPSGLHAEHAIAAARQGLHVLVEKPLDITTARIDALLEEVQTAGVTLGVFFQDRLKPDVVTMKRMIDDRRIGPPVLATGEVKWYRPPEYYAGSRWRGTWTLDGGGALMNQGIHTVDLLLHVLGPVARVTGSIATRVHKIEAEDTAVAALQFVNGAVATLAATTAAYPGKPRRLEIVGSEGSLLLEGDRLVEVNLRASGGGPVSSRMSETPENTASPVVSDVEPHRRIIEDFFDAIRSQRPPICDGAEGRRSVEVVEAVYRSARDGVSIELTRRD